MNIKRVFFLGLVVFFALAGCTVTETKGPKVDKKKVLHANVKLGMTYLDKGMRDGALRAFSKAIETDSKSAEAQLGMALIHQLNGEFEMADKRFKKALRSRADFTMADIEFSYGRFLMEQDNCSDALKYFESASKELTYRRRVNALFNIGLCAEKMGEPARAESSYKHALNINPNFAAAAIELAHKRFEAGDYSASKRYLDQFARNARQSARSLWLGIRIERIFGNKDKEASYAIALKNLHPYSREYLQYKKLKEAEEQ